MGEVLPFPDRRAQRLRERVPVTIELALATAIFAALPRIRVDADLDGRGGRAHVDRG